MKDTITVGKVKTVFSTDDPNKVLIQYEDKVTAGNGRQVDFPEGKGAICCKISEILFKEIEKREPGVLTHYISTIPERIMCCQKLKVIPLEVVVRNVAAGSILRETTLEEGFIFKAPLVEYYLKDDEKNDPLLTDDRIWFMGLKEWSDTMNGEALRVNRALTTIFDKIGFTLVDYKLEFGWDSKKRVVLCDELSPDNMRLWKKGTEENFDKDLFRKGNGDIVEAYQYILSKLEQETN